MKLAYSVTASFAIVAALIAVGYAPKQVYDPATQSGLLAGDLTDLFGPGRWHEWERFADSLMASLEGGSPLEMLRRFAAFQNE